MLGAYEKARQASSTGRWGWIALGGAAVGLQFLAGNLHISFYMLLIFALYVIATAWWRGRRGEAAARAFAAAAAMALLGVALAALQLLPTLEFAARSARRSITYATVLTYHLPWPYLFAGLMPDLFGNPVDYNHWGCFLGQQYRAYTETAWYTGAFTFVLALVALLRRPSRAVGFWAGVAVLSFALALGSPLDFVLYSLVPGFRQLPGINRAIVMACFALPVLAAWGAQVLLKDRREGATTTALRSLGWATGLAGLLGFCGALWAWMASAPYETAGLTTGAQPWLQFVRMAVLLALPVGAAAMVVKTGRAGWGLVALLVLAADVGYFAGHFFPLVPERFCHPPSAIIADLQDRHQVVYWGQPFRLLSVGENALTDRLPPNVPMLFGLEDVQGSDSITYGRYMRLLKALRPPGTPPPGQPDPAQPFLSAMGVRALLTTAEAPPRAGLTPALVEGRCKLYVLARSEAYALVTTRPRAAASDEEMLALTVQQHGPGEDAPGAPVMLATDLGGGTAPAAQRQGPGHAASAAAKVAVLRRLTNPNVLIAELRPRTGAEAQETAGSASAAGPSGKSGAAPSGAWLVVHDTYYPGWHAYAGDRELPMTVADYCFRAVRLPGGLLPERVVFVYWPSAFVFGGFLTLLGVVLTLALLTAAGGGRRRKALGQEGGL
ncbi:MAG: hypothetical protein J7M26_09065, partial [Armatimonadetes bacterium]|nr:hypothetical protein [Armatimonadota bacterium]